MKQPDTTLTKADTVALWHAIQWMESVLTSWRRDGFLDGSRPQYDDQRELMLQAKRALRKVNAIRKGQARRRTSNVQEVQEQRETAGGAGA